MRIRQVESHDKQQLIELIARFRQTLARLRHKEEHHDLESAQAELDEYRQKDFPIYVAETDEGRLVGYLVCRVEGDVVWAESLFVLPEYRRQGIGSALYAEAEELARELGSETLYNWVDPLNHRMIGFLQQRGYTVLNLIEVRKAAPGESMTRKIRVGAHEFDHY